MPKYRSQHATDGKGICKKLVDQELTERLEHLADEASRHHRAAQEHWRGWLDHAKEAGDALVEAKRRRGHGGKWGQWRQRHIIDCGIMSKETACIYMRIAREWGDPRLVEARTKGVRLDSIRSVLRVLRGDAPTKPDPRDRRPGETEDECWDRLEQYEASDEGRKRRQQEEADMMRQAIRREFATKLRELDVNELRVLWDTFEDDLWGELFANIRNTLSGVCGDDYGDDEELVRIANAKIKPVLNKTARKRITQQAGRGRA